jgi:hypothetical protein
VRKLFILALVTGISVNVFGQDTSKSKEIKPEEAIVAAKPATKNPYFNFKNGIGFATPDSAYSINIRFRMQNRLLMNSVSDEDLNPGSFEFRVRRCRLVLAGHVYNPKWSYYLQLSFSRGDMDWDMNQASNVNTSVNVVRDAMIYYKPFKNMQIGFGQTKLPGNRQRVVSSGSLQFYDRSPANANFTLDRDAGFFASYFFNIGKFKTIIKGAVTSGEGRNSNSSNPGLAYSGRIEFLPMGDFTDAGDYFEGDVAREEKPKLSFGGGFHLNDLAVRTQGQLGRDLYEARSYETYHADLLFKFNGFALSSEYIRRNCDNPVTKNSAGSTRAVVEGDGINTQISYCFKSRWEIAARHTLVSPHHDLYASMNENEQYGLGLTKYIMKHKVKVQGNIFYNRERNLNTSKDSNKHWLGVLQLELGI